MAHIFSNLFLQLYFISTNSVRIEIQW